MTKTKGRDGDAVAKPKGRLPPEVMHAIDRHVGNRIREQREKCGLSRSDVAEHLDLHFEQIRKYEAGINSISAGALHRLAKYLEVSSDYFFREMPDDLRQAIAEANSNLPPDIVEAQRKLRQLADSSAKPPTPS